MAAAKQVEPAGETGTAGAEPEQRAAPSAVTQAQEPALTAVIEKAKAEPEKRAAPPAMAALQEPAAAEATGTAQTVPEQPAPPTIIAALQEVAAAGAAESGKVEVKRNTGNTAADAPVVASAAAAIRKAAAGPGRRIVHRQRAAARKAAKKPGQRTRTLEAASFLQPELQEESEPDWVSSRKTMALRWPSAGEPRDESEDRTR